MAAICYRCVRCSFDRSGFPDKVVSQISKQPRPKARRTRMTKGRRQQIVGAPAPLLLPGVAGPHSGSSLASVGILRDYLDLRPPLAAARLDSVSTSHIIRSFLFVFLDQEGSQGEPAGNSGPRGAQANPKTIRPSPETSWS